MRYLLIYELHLRNRGGLLINAFNAHRNGSRICRVGANKKELHGAVCFELPIIQSKLKDLTHCNHNHLLFL